MTVVEPPAMMVPWATARTCMHRFRQPVNCAGPVTATCEVMRGRRGALHKARKEQASRSHQPKVMGACRAVPLARPPP
jgi:hypothetical protein